MRTIKPTAGNVFIDPIEDTLLPVGSIIQVAETARLHKQAPRMGTVVAVGGKLKTKNGVILDPEFKVGDKVVFRPYKAGWFIVDGKELMQVKQHDIETVLYEGGSNL